MPGGATLEPLRARCDDPPPDALRRGIEQFNAGEFFEQHETLEILWRDTRAPVRDLYHGILQIGVGLHHWRNGNFHGAETLLAAGIERVAPFAPECHGVDVAALVNDAGEALRRLRDIGRDDIGAVAPHAPRIRLREA